MSFHHKTITHVSHVSIKVQDLQRSIAFYRDIIGFTVHEQTNNTAALTADGHATILSLEQPDHMMPKQNRTTGLYHFAILLPTRRDLANFVYHSVEKGLPLASADHLVSEALYFNDPDGNGIEVYRDRDPASWTWHGSEVVMTVDPLNFEDLLTAGQPQAWQGLPAETVMGHIHLHVADLEKAKLFYEKGLGFETVSQLGNQALFISTGHYHHHIGLNTWNGVGAPVPAEASVGLRAYTISYPTEASVHHVIEQLHAMNVAVQHSSKEWFTQDPSGNAILLTY
ncbi:VOC family protein [Gracilibacillus alcaliphilus]|uniref:VOC family protein n=1 Tax=Gracilibacillus alcaliphilus TaxID=1401441 RepID=UPI00195C0A08|nr:VOC family protein [Gracilibacillus alcaliphilus]MBM7676082.1 catechol 2,3-dioxygenase [Gracilibacillus alcaliphilus]